MIRVQPERGAHAGNPDLSCPKFFCKLCNRPIDQAENGLYVWDARLENEAYYAGEPVEVYTVHKRECDAYVCFVKGWPRSDPATMEIRTLSVYLAHDMGIRVGKDWDNARGPAEFGGAT
jgi:hypothetical protein